MTTKTRLRIFVMWVSLLPFLAVCWLLGVRITYDTGLYTIGLAHKRDNRRRGSDTNGPGASSTE